MAGTEVDSAELKAVNWRRFQVGFGIVGMDEKIQSIRFTRSDLRILKLLLTKEIGGEVPGSSGALHAFLQFVTSMEAFMAERDME